ncbi:hypothetical protein N566_08100 [Streptomycetaceae bacterium MP113-05]|nr:hypothetical protein N566_08100 [Streptomycetaceae bacterium MP113-05]
MHRPRRFLALAGLLSGIVLLQSPVAQADDAPEPVCGQTERGYLCSEQTERTYRMPDGHQVRSQTRTTVTCTAGGQAPQADQNREDRQETVTECAGSSAR